MSLPFGLDFVSLIVGIILAWFVIPRVMGFFSARKAQTAAS